MNDDKVNEDPMEFVNQEPDEPVADPTPKPTARPRSGTASRNQGNSKLIIGVVVVAVVIAAALLWPRGGNIDDSVSVMTLENQPVPAVDTPASSDVNIDEAVTEIVPESSEATTPKPKPKPAPKPEPAKVVAAPKPAVNANIGAPGAEGSWGVQVFASSTRQGADKYKAKMDAKGFRAVVRSGDDGTHRVWIGYFKSRDYAEAWKRTNSGSIPDKTMVKQR